MKTFCIFCKRKTDSISSTYNISYMKYIRIFCIECRKDKNRDTIFYQTKWRDQTKNYPNRFKVTLIQGTPRWVMQTLNSFNAVTCKCLIKVINTTNRGSNNWRLKNKYFKWYIMLCPLCKKIPLYTVSPA